MNWLYIIVMSYIVLSALRGYRKGFIKVIYSMAALIAAIVFVIYTAPMFDHFIREYTPAYDQIETGCEGFIRDQVGQKIEEGSVTDAFSWPGIGDILKGILEDTSVTDTMMDILEEQGIFQKMAEVMAGFCVRMIAFILSAIVVLLLLLLISRKLDLFSKTPGIHIINMILGFFAGIAKSFLVIWIFFAVIRFTELLPSSTALIRIIENNAVLLDIYEHNPLYGMLK